MARFFRHIEICERTIRISFQSRHFRQLDKCGCRSPRKQLFGGEGHLTIVSRFNQTSEISEERTPSHESFSLLLGCDVVRTQDTA